MKGEIEIASDLGSFEGFNFRTQSAIPQILTAQQVIDWDHDANGEAEFWPHGDNGFVRAFVSGNVTADELLELDRIFTELKDNEHEIAKAYYLKSCHGSELKDIDRQAIDNACLYVFGPGWRCDLEKEAAYELFEMFWPEAYKQWEANTVPGLQFDAEAFLNHFPHADIKLSEGNVYLIVDTE